MNERMRSASDVGALWGRTDLSILESDGPDLLNLLNRLSTQKVDAIEVGDSAATVLTSSKGRILERLWLTRLEPGRTILIAGPGRAEAVLQHLKRYTFAEKTGLRDASDEWALLVPFGDWRLPDGLPGTLLPHDVDSDSGRSVLLPRGEYDAALASLREAISAAGGVELNAEEQTRLRILRGLPAAGYELTDSYNPLEAGMRYAISFNKGCYIGQEIVARLNTYDKVSRTLLGVQVDPDRSLTIGDSIHHGGKSVGIVTSASSDIALGYVKHRDAAAGDEVQIGDSDGPSALLVALPFSAG